jgi:hypothetical protein
MGFMGIILDKSTKVYSFTDSSGRISVAKFGRQICRKMQPRYAKVRYYFARP